jgi:hypothetical protein
VGAPTYLYMADGRLIVWRASLCLKPRRKTVLNPGVAEDADCECAMSRRLRGAEARPQLVVQPPLVIGYAPTLQLFPDLGLYLRPLFGAASRVEAGKPRKGGPGTLLAA